MKKKYLILILVLFLTGCSAEYNLKISNDNFKENISFVVEKQNIQQLTNDGIELDDQLTPFINEKTEAVMDESKFYKKKVKEDDNFTYVDMKYNYDEIEFGKSSSINLCFEYPELDFSSNYYIHLQGEFYCLYSDSIDIKIETNNKVYSNNADEVSGNVYIWHVNENNKDFVDIEIEVDKGMSLNMIFGVIISIFVILIISVVGYMIYKKRRENNII